MPTIIGAELSVTSVISVTTELTEHSITQALTLSFVFPETIALTDNGMSPTRKEKPETYPLSQYLQIIPKKYLYYHNLMIRIIEIFPRNNFN